MISRQRFFSFIKNNVSYIVKKTLLKLSLTIEPSKRVSKFIQKLFTKKITFQEIWESEE